MKSFSSILVLIFMLTCFFAASCSEKANETDTTAPVTNEITEDMTERIPDELPEINYDGDEIRILTSCWSNKDLNAEEQTADTMNDAIYARNLKVQERFNVVIKPVLESGSENDFGPAMNAFRKAVATADDIYHAFYTIQAVAITDATNNILVDLYELDNINLSKPWWDSGIYDVCIGDKVFFATGAIHLSTSSYTTLIAFNKNLFREWNIEYPYGLVSGGEWSYDNFISIIKDTQRDLNGDSKIDIDNDLYSIGGWQYEVGYNFHTSLGGNEVIKNSEGELEINILNENSIKALQRTIDIFADYGGFYNNVEYGRDRKLFKSSRLLMLDARFMEIEALRDMEDDFGMLPHPRAEAGEAVYTQLVNSNVATVVVVPVTNQDLEMTGIILEALASESYYEIVPVYSEVMLRIKLTRDSESEEMLDFIWNNRTYRYGLETYNDVIRDLIAKKDYNFVSKYERLNTKALREIEKISKTFNN